MELPADFLKYLRETMRDDVAGRIVRGLDEPPSVSIRLNPAAGLSPSSLGSGVVPWCELGFYLDERPAFTADPMFHAGAYYVQEASSMFVWHVIRTLLPQADRPWQRCLDLCAAPGGKSTLLRSALPADCLLVSNEPIRQRAQVLAENLAKWGQLEVVVTQAYPREFSGFEAAFDLILADVPCSGEGMMRKEAEAVAQWSGELVSECADRQRSIIADVWPALRPGGFLIYSTCTFNRQEDEDNVEWIARELGGEVIAVPVDAEWHVDGDLRPGGTLPCCHFLPGTVRGEGFFCAVVRKEGVGDDESVAVRPHRHRKSGRDARPLTFSELLSRQMTVLPTDQLDAAGSPQVELSLTESLRYLRGESLVLPPDVSRGVVQVCFRGRRLGLMKNVGNRANNLYPQAWRIRSSHLTPQTIIPV